MPPASPRLARSPSERLVAWVFTGPLGHLWSVVADLGVFAARSLLSRARRRLSPARRR